MINRKYAGGNSTRHAVSSVLACAVAVALCAGCGGEMPFEDAAEFEDVDESEFALDSWSGSFEVNVGGVWKGVSCSGSKPELRDTTRTWQVTSDRVLVHTAHAKRLKCPEGALGQECTCTTGSGERMHGTTTGSKVATGAVQISLSQSKGAWIFADLDSGYKDICVRVESGRLFQRKGSCHNFRLRK